MQRKFRTLPKVVIPLFASSDNRNESNNVFVFGLAILCKFSIRLRVDGLNSQHSATDVSPLSRLIPVQLLLHQRSTHRLYLRCVFKKATYMPSEKALRFWVLFVGSHPPIMLVVAKSNSDTSGLP
ncbi:hypothetical protein AX14_001495 [Amanita brunnescens Koide BX004]|nr:hypothetical protein AX14_001495 [Amanita brunnescens Koide BX004]